MQKHSTTEKHAVLRAILKELGEHKTIVDAVDGEIAASFVEWTKGDLSLYLGVDDRGAYVTFMGADRTAKTVEEAAALVRGVMNDEVVAVAGYDKNMIVYVDLAPADAPTRGIGRLDGRGGGDFPPMDRLQVCSWSGKLDHDTAQDKS